MKFLLIILLAGVFLGGYHLGRQPGSPDIFAWYQKAYGQVKTYGEDVVPALLDQSRRDASDGDANGKIPVKIDGKVYMIGK